MLDYSNNNYYEDEDPEDEPDEDPVDPMTRVKDNKILCPFCNYEWDDEMIDVYSGDQKISR